MYADDLLEQAHHLARREKRKPKQASLRRAVSTAYYALFHLLTTEAVANWKHTDQRADLARAFEHGRMKAASLKVGKSSYPGHRNAIVANLRLVAATFAQLQQDRHIADYDNSTQWARSEVLDQINRVGEVFQSWRNIRSETIAQDYLLSLFVKDR